MWFMAMFGLGTLPLMFALIYSQSFIPPSFKQKITQYAPVMMAGFAVLLILRGMNIGIPYISPQLMHEGGSLHANCCHKP
jgi:sulfite exporter TauE/SafE